MRSESWKLEKGKQREEVQVEIQGKNLLPRYSTEAFDTFRRRLHISATVFHTTGLSTVSAQQGTWTQPVIIRQQGILSRQRRKAIGETGARTRYSQIGLK